MSIYREWVGDVFNSAIYGTVFARNLVILLVIANRGSASFPVTFPDLKMAPEEKKFIGIVKAWYFSLTNNKTIFPFLIRAVIEEKISPLAVWSG